MKATLEVSANEVILDTQIEGVVNHIKFTFAGYIDAEVISRKISSCKHR